MSRPIKPYRTRQNRLRVENLRERSDVTIARKERRSREERAPYVPGQHRG